MLKNQHVPKTFLNVFLRKGLVTFQFIISVVFIIGTIIIIKQMTFIKKKDLGFEKDQIIIVNDDNNILQKQISVLKSELLQNNNIEDITQSMIVTPGTFSGIDLISKSSTNDDVTLYWGIIDYNFFDFFGIDIIKGRDFSKQFATDAGSSLIINETAVKQLGWDEPLGKQIVDKRWGVDGNVIGVVKDFHNVSLHEEIKPIVYQVVLENLSSFFIRIQPQNMDDTITYIKKTMLSLSPNMTFYYHFLDDRIDRAYREDNKIFQIFKLAASLSILIASLGLVGLISFSVDHRTKEIGIRKVLGASSSRIVNLLTLDFVVLIIIANGIAWPIAYYIMKDWLQDFSYRIDLEVWPFLLSGLLTIIISWLTVGFHAIKTARANPVDVLKYE